MKIIKYSCLVGNYDEPIQDGRLYVNGGNKCNTDRLNSRMVKVLPHLFLPEHDYSIWVDSNIELLVSDETLINMMDGKDCLVFKHPYRENINEEILECLRYDTKENVNYHKDKEGVLASCGVIVRKNNEQTQRLNEKWWAEICRGSFRDQLSFPYTLGTISKYIKTEWEKPFNSVYTKWHPHKQNTKTLSKEEIDKISKHFYKS